MKYNMDKLYEAVAERGPVCVGLDTSIEHIPPAELRRAASPTQAVLGYNKALVDATMDIAACFKIQIAYYEEMGIDGLRVYAETLRYIREKGCLTIADIKRGDIADTAARYARAHFSGEFEADFVTLSPYMGMDSIKPWIDYIQDKGKGAFILMRTSNPGMRDFEYREFKNGERLYDAVGHKLCDLMESYLGRYGYGAFGAVVGADPKTSAEREEAREIRRKRSNLFFLMPGYGAQGGTAADAVLCLRQGNGGVINASRSILRAWMASSAAADEVDTPYAAAAARRAVLSMRDDIQAAVKAGELLSRQPVGHREDEALRRGVPALAFSAS